MTGVVGNGVWRLLVRWALQKLQTRKALWKALLRLFGQSRHRCAHGDSSGPYGRLTAVRQRQATRGRQSRSGRCQAGSPAGGARRRSCAAAAMKPTSRSGLTKGARAAGRPREQRRDDAPDKAGIALPGIQPAGGSAPVMLSSYFEPWVRSRISRNPALPKGYDFFRRSPVRRFRCLGARPRRVSAPLR